MPATRRPVLIRARILALAASGLVWAPAGVAFAANHDLQRVSHRNCHFVQHDRALGPVASAEPTNRGVN